MANIADLEIQLNSLLTEAAKKLKLKKFSLDLDVGAQKGDGFLGELYKASVTDEETNKKFYLVIKKAPVDPQRRDGTCVDMAYKNEIQFYSTIWPELRKFQEDHHVAEIFHKVPIYITSHSKSFEEMIVLEDLTKTGFQLREKHLVWDEEHVRLIFETYGRFHAVSFCLKDQNYEKFDFLTKNLSNVIKEFGKKSNFSHAFTRLVAKSYKALDEGSKVQKEFKKYVDDTMGMYNRAVDYDGEYSCLLHGDCWSNNMMFKYYKDKIEDMRLLDFQITWVASPVFDLSYFFYSGGSKKLFDNLETFLDIYYNSFSKFAKELGSDPNKLLPRKALTEDWKKYSKWGMMMALLLTHIKLMTREESAEIAESVGKGSKFFGAKIDDDLFNEKVRDILIHMFEIGAL